MDAEFRIRLVCDAGDAEKIIGQDPMGELDGPIVVTINGHEFVATCEGYVQTDGRATLTIHSSESCYSDTCGRHAGHKGGHVARDWRCPTCRSPRVAAVSDAGAVTCGGGHVSY